MYKQHKIVALCITRINDDRNTDIVMKLSEALRRYGCSLFVYNACSDFYWHNKLEEGERHVFDLIDYDITDAVIVFTETFRDDGTVARQIADTARAHKKPVITLGGEIDGCINFVFDYAAGFESAVRHIIETHHITDTAMMAGLKGEANSDQRIAAYKKVLAENGLPFDENMLLYGGYWSGPTQEAVRRLIDEKRVPRAIVCINDVTAIAVCSELQQHGFNVPDDVAVVGFDGIEEAKQCVPPITTCKCSYSDTADAIADCIDDVLSGGTADSINEIPYVLDIFRSCGCDLHRRPYNMGNMLKNIGDRFYRFQDDNAAFCEIIQEAAAEADIGGMIRCLAKYNFYDTCVFVNKSFCDETVNPMNETWEGFGDEMCLLYKSEEDITSLPMDLRRADIYPGADFELERGNPLVFNVLTFFGVPIGYMCVHFRPVIDNYCKIPQFVYALDNALSGFRNIMHLKYAAKSLERASERDYMTGIYNRNGFYKALSRLISEHGNSDFSVASVDMDGLKYINDRFGHNGGDFAIASIAAAIRELPLDDKICGRFGGDEFVICAVKTPDDDEKLIREHIAAYLGDIVRESKVPYDITVSIGVSRSDGKFDFDSLLKISDEKMYAEKSGKPNHRK